MPLLTRFPDADSHSAILADRDDAEFAIRLRSALGVLLFVWTSGALVDWLGLAGTADRSQLSRLVLWSSLVPPLVIAFWRLGRNPRPSAAHIRIAELCAFAGASALLGVLAMIGQTGSWLYSSLVILLLALRTAYFPREWRHALGSSLLVAFAYGAMPLVGGIVSGQGPPSAAVTPIAGGFGATQLVIATAMIACLVAGDRVSGLARLPFRGRVLGHYRLLRELGRGGMAWVWEAYDTGHRRRVALKIVRRRDVTAVKRLEREIAATRALNHPNVVRIYDYGVSSEGLWFYAMELLRGESLEELVHREGPLPWKRVEHIGRQLSAALLVAHQAGILHRDLKPKNIMIIQKETTRDVVKLLDFGVARITNPTTTMTDLTGRGFVPGTPDYLAPEAYEEGEVDFRADVYGVGLVLHFLLTGGLPNSRADGSGLSESLAHPEPLAKRFKTELPDWFASLIERCISRNPEDRYASAIELHRDFERGSTTGSERDGER